MRISKGYLFRACNGKRVSHCHLHFGRDSKVDREMGKLDSGKRGRLQVFPEWRLLARGKDAAN